MVSQAGWSCKVGPARPAGPITPVGLARSAGPITPVGLARSAGPITPVGLARSAGPVTPVGLARSAGPVTPVGLARSAGPVTPVGLARSAGPVTPVGPAWPAGPVTPVGPAWPTGPETPVGPARSAGPVTPVGLARSAGPVTPLAPARPAGRARLCLWHAQLCTSAPSVDTSTCMNGSGQETRVVSADWIRVLIATISGRSERRNEVHSHSPRPKAISGYFHLHLPRDADRYIFSSEWHNMTTGQTTFALHTFLQMVIRVQWLRWRVAVYSRPAVMCHWISTWESLSPKAHMDSAMWFKDVKYNQLLTINIFKYRENVIATCGVI